jgi:hypothetical protein
MIPASATRADEWKKKSVSVTSVNARRTTAAGTRTRSTLFSFTTRSYLPEGELVEAATVPETAVEEAVLTVKAPPL